MRNFATRRSPSVSGRKPLLHQLTVVTFAGAILALPSIAPAATMQVLYAFPGSERVGCYPDGTLLRDAAGSLHGTTYACGTYNSGTVYRLKSPPAGQSRWTPSLLYTFRGGDDGGTPNAGLVMDRAGALYGTTTYGGRSLQGVVYKLTPSAGGAWRQTVLHDFHYNYAYGDRDGANPGAGLVMDGAGALYGTTIGGGNPSISGWGYGTVFKLTPPRPGQTAWTETVLYRFAGGLDGWNPVFGVTVDAAGAVYGTTLHGGRGTCRDNWGTVVGCGTIFKLTPPNSPQAIWKKTTIYRFGGGSDGGQPHGSLFISRSGVLYGTTFMGGRSHCSGGTPSTVIGCGTIYRFTPPATVQGTWTKAILHEFKGPDGAFPQGGLIAGAGGAFYGTASSGADGYGVVYRLSPPTAGQTRWAQTVLHKLNISTSGYTPVGELTADRAGRLFGVSFWGGRNLVGTVFAVSP